MSFQYHSLNNDDITFNCTSYCANSSLPIFYCYYYQKMGLYWVTVCYSTMQYNKYNNTHHTK